MANHQKPKSVELDCAASEQALMDRFDGLPIADPGALARHLAGCAPCRELHSVAGRLGEGLRAGQPPLPPAGFGDRIMAAVLVDQRQLRRWPRQTRRALALAASVLLVFFLAGEQRSRRVPPPPVRDAEAVAEMPVGSLRDSVAEAGSAVVSLTTRAADETVGQSRLLVPVVASATPMDDPMDLDAVEPPVKALLNAGQGVSSGLEPLTNSARRAFGLFLRELPPMDPEPTRPGI